MYIHTYREGAKKVEPGSFQWCPVTGQEAMDTNWNKAGFFWTSRNIFTIRVTEHWNTLPRETGHGHGKHPGGPPRAERIGQDDLSRGPFQPQPFFEIGHVWAAFLNGEVLYHFNSHKTICIRLLFYWIQHRMGKLAFKSVFFFFFF